MLYKRGKIWWVKFTIKGNLFQRSSRSTSKKQAQKFEQALRHKVLNELHTRSGLTSLRTYGDAVNKWVDSGAPESMYSHARNTLPALKDIPLHLVVPKAHEMKNEMLGRGLSPQTINRRLAVVRRVLNIAYQEWEWLDEPLGQKIKLMSEKGLAREIYLSKAAVRELIGAIPHETARNVTLLAAYTGLRQGELLKLEPGNWQPPFLILSNKTKAKKPRTVPVIEELHGLIQLPFTITYHELRTNFERARKAIGRPELRFHDLRHTFASWLAQDPTVPLTVIRDVLGHSNLSVTSKYAHLRSDSFQVISEALNRIQK